MQFTLPLRNYKLISFQGSVFSPYLYDTVSLYVQLVHETLLSGNGARNGSLILSLTQNVTFTGNYIQHKLKPVTNVEQC